MQRSLNYCEMVAEKHKGKNVLIVTHAANIQIMDYYFKGKPSDYNFFKPCGVKNGGLATFDN
jgi:broad specificity phosphatase PhoE